MNDVVYVVRQLNGRGECMTIWGVYKTEESANGALLTEYPGLEFDYRLWRWQDRINYCFYRVDAFTVN